MNEQNEQPGKKSESVDLEELLREKEKLDSIIKRKFTKTITMMFTDLSGSTSMSEQLGDLAMRAILRNHNDIVFPIIKSNNGTLVKTMGDGTMSYFEDASDAVKAAIEIQRSIDEYNMKRSEPTLLIRCGLNTGLGLVEKQDVHGDVVNVAQRFEALAEPKEILMSRETHGLVKDNKEFCVMFLKETHLKGKMGPQKVYKALWSDEEIELYKEGGREALKKAEKYTDGAMTADVEAVEEEKASAKTVSAARIVVDHKGKSPVSYDLTGDVTIIGRSSKADIVLPEVFISRKHAKVSREGDKFYIEDLGSKISVICKGEKITRREMNDGDEFVIGSIKLTFQAVPPDISKEAEEMDPNATMAFSLSKVFRLDVEEKGEIVASHDLTETPLLIGRTGDCHIQLSKRVVSRKHAKIYLAGDKVHIEDLKSNNGTLVNGKRIDKAEVTPDDEINIGPFILRVIDPARPSPGPEGREGVMNLTKKVFSFLSKK